MFCISRILPGGVIFTLDIKIYLYQNISTHSVTGEFSLDLSEMRPVNVVTSLMCHLKRPLSYGGYLCNQIQQNNFEMC